jgi:hypothetical protein
VFTVTKHLDTALFESDGAKDGAGARQAMQLVFDDFRLDLRQAARSACP